MSNRRGPNLGERAAATRAAQGLDPVPRAAVAQAVDPPDLDALGRRHCWVIGPPESPGPWPGLIVEWHRGEGGWRARVVYLSELGGGATVVQTWLEAGLLRPA